MNNTELSHNKHERRKKKKEVRSKKQRTVNHRNKSNAEPFKSHDRKRREENAVAQDTHCKMLHVMYSTNTLKRSTVQ